MDDLEHETRRKSCQKDCCDLNCVLIVWLFLSALPSIASNGSSVAANTFGIVVVCLPAFLVLCTIVFDQITMPHYAGLGLDTFIPVYVFMVLVISSAIVTAINVVLSSGSQPLPFLLLTAGAAAFYMAFPFALTFDLETDFVFAAVIAVHVQRGFTLLSSLYSLILAMAIWNHVLF